MNENEVNNRHEDENKDEDAEESVFSGGIQLCKWCR